MVQLDFLWSTFIETFICNLACSSPLFTVLFKNTQRKCFTNFAQAVVGARREGDGNPLSGVVAEQWNFLVVLCMHISSWNAITKYLNDENLIRQSRKHRLKGRIQIKKTWTRLKRWNQPLSTEKSTLLSDFAYCSVQNWEFWSCTTIFLQFLWCKFF